VRSKTKSWLLACRRHARQTPEIDFSSKSTWYRRRARPFQ
jgi:hypothetical protein